MLAEVRGRPIGIWATMYVMRRRFLIAHGAPGCLILVALLVVALNRDAWWSLIPLAAAMVTAPLWPLAALKFSPSVDERRDLVTALNFQLTVLVGLAIGGVLLLLFVGVVVLLGLLIVEVVFSLDSARRVWTGEPVAQHRRMIQFVK